MSSTPPDANEAIERGSGFLWPPSYLAL